MPGQVSWFDQHGVPTAAIVIFYGVALALMIGALIGKQDFGIVKTPEIVGGKRIIFGVLGFVAFWACLTLGGTIPLPGGSGHAGLVIPRPGAGAAAPIDEEIAKP